MRLQTEEKWIFYCENVVKRVTQNTGSLCLY